MIARMTAFANVATAAAVALAAVTAGPAPARADEKDMLKALAGIAAVAIVAGALSQHNRGAFARSEPIPAPRNPGVPAWQADHADWQRGWHGSRGGNDRWSPDWSYNRDARGGLRLPATCAVEIDGRRPTTLYPDTCLRREGFRAPLPQVCAQEIRSRDWSGRVYDGDCLREAGFRTGRR